MLGHNLSPYDRIHARADELTQIANRWLVERPAIDNDEIASKLDGFLGQLDAEIKAAKAEQVIEKDPHLAASNAIDARWKALSTPLEYAKKVLRQRLVLYLLAKQEKIDQARRDAERNAQRLMEEADRDSLELTIEAAMETAQRRNRVEAAMKAVAAMPARAAVKGEFSERARSLRSVWGAKVSDIDAALNHYRNHPDVRETLERLASAEARGGVRELPGFEIKETKS